MFGYFDKRYSRDTERLKVSTTRKRENKERDKIKVHESFQKIFKGFDMNLISKHKIANTILKDIVSGTMSLNKIKYLLRELNEEGKISLPCIK
jgi:hypothetical protein